MESYLIITQLNDFIFCPYSIYFHNIYQNDFDESMYQQTPQKIGQTAHKNIDAQIYSSSKNILQGITVYCEKYNFVGKIDLFNIDSGELIERKYSVTQIYDGFRYQIYAQYLALKEMGYDVKKLKIYSKKDNKNYEIKLPNPEEIENFEKIIKRLKSFSFDENFTQNPIKCKKCIYNPLCHIYHKEN